MSDSNTPAPQQAPAKDWTRNPIVLGGAAVVIIGAIVGAYFLGSAGPRHAATTAAAGGAQTHEALAARNICQAALDRVREIGVVEPDATLVSDDATDTGVKDRVLCNVKGGGLTYKVTVQQMCSDMADAKCIALWNVTDSAGTVDYQHRDYDSE